MLGVLWLISMVAAYGLQEEAGQGARKRWKDIISPNFQTGERAAFWL